jgi:hypothetical protein
METFANLDITSANSKSILTVDELYPAGIELSHFSADTSLAVDSIQMAETRMGVDGEMVAGYTPNIVPVTITLEAASPSFSPFALIAAAMRQNQRVYGCILVCTVPSIKKVFTFDTGVLQSGTPFPTGNKVLAPTSWVFHFKSVSVASI